ncbi:hypothetical protein [uncultured Draconibacterium sp.]|uniref:hypothetical protein n=1 Tax=uncultured Draconibacterium sp. TaxID=1573823 RepID=UPI0025EDF64B|nr:hypothetical protein [uncultured Draconibacterium sp.]
MANQDDYLAKEETIMAIPDEETLVPNLPMDNYLQSSENLYHWALDDFSKLKTLGLTREMLDDLPVRTGAARYAQSVWNKDYNSQQEAQKRWTEEAPAAFELRDELLRTLRYAYRKDPALLSRVRAIAEGEGNDDLIQDLSDLSVLGKENPEPLTAMGFDLSLLDTAESESDNKATLLAEANGDKAIQNQSKVLRDKAYTHLKELSDEIREAGKFLFWNDKTRYKGYTLSYWTRRKRKSGTDDTNMNTDTNE